MSRLVVPFACASLLIAAPAMALPITAGLEVVDPQGDVVGKVSGLDADANVVIDTGAHKAAYPIFKFRPSGDHLVFALTKDEVDSAAAAKDAAASVAIGKPIKGTDGIALGTIESINGEVATLRLQGGQTVNFPMNAITGDAGGAIAGISSVQLKAQLDAAGAAGAAPPAAQAPAS